MQIVVTPVQERAGSIGTAARGIIEGIAIAHANGLIDRLSSGTEKAIVASRLLKSGTLTDKAQEMFVSILTEHGTYQQLVSVLDSGKLTSGEALGILKARIRTFSDGTALPSNSFTYHPKK